MSLQISTAESGINVAEKGVRVNPTFGPTVRVRALRVSLTSVDSPYLAQSYSSSKTAENRSGTMISMWPVRLYPLPLCSVGREMTFVSGR